MRASPASLVRVIVTVFRRISKERVPEAAAGMAFYAVFSLFPVLLLAVAVGSRFMESADMQERILSTLLRFLPVSREFVRQNVVSVIRIRGAVGGIGLVGLLWAATGAFSILVRNLGRAWGDARQRTLIGERLAALALVGSVVALVVLYVLARSLASAADNWVVARQAAEVVSRIAGLSSGLTIAVFILVGLTILYRWLPRTRVLWREAAAGSGFATVGLWATTSAFSGFIASGLVKYNVVYGSLGTLLALLTWVYMASLIVLVGAHVSASVAYVTRGETSGSGVREEDDGACDAVLEKGE